MKHCFLQGPEGIVCTNVLLSRKREKAKIDDGQNFDRMVGNTGKRRQEKQIINR